MIGYLDLDHPIAFSDNARKNGKSDYVIPQISPHVKSSKYGTQMLLIIRGGSLTAAPTYALDHHVDFQWTFITFSIDFKQNMNEWMVTNLQCAQAVNRRA